jgi:hypothetical protein
MVLLTDGTVFCYPGAGSGQRDCAFMQDAFIYESETEGIRSESGRKFQVGSSRFQVREVSSSVEVRLSDCIILFMYFEIYRL